ncbi:carboxypeptidase-like regulatory domain-containing protein [Roseisolibacter sp. H3M3-2]|uniref:carboxypeptidase-like regulatory domain-containing protein n=1 Tax=Roseisolibacter sp. H3M3-2 TaxID=3031323 RepID=UPI0023DBAD44|nr:carboxypeptidase-like regulatory domain-containing protein [Roseisolibacter sp. H3M3-2]MDF1502680.1 carboxypeptidase-like regulatory domain-containing protein [Roseisolibacter sp. H3M3-2]
MLRRITALALALLLPAAAAPLAAQGGPEVVRGRVTDDSARAVFAAAITVTRGPDRLVQTTTTDSLGRYSVRFDPGTGDYLVHVAAPGYRAARRRVERQGTERELVADFALGRDLATLAAVQIRERAPVRADNRVTPFTPETGAAEKYADGVQGQLPPTAAGNLGALAGTIPGVTLTPTGPAILGVGGESNLTTLNGMALPGGSIPRAARTETRVTGATFDPTRGGFSGANIDVRLGPGDRFYQRRNGFLTLDAPQLQFTDAVGRASGAANGGFRGSLGADGELIRQALTYNVALDVARNTSDPATLLNAEAETLLRAGVSPDSVARLLALTAPLGLPLTGGGIPSARNRDAVTWLGRLDDTRDSLRTRTLTSYAGYTREGALGFGPLTAPSVGGRRRETSYGGQLVFGDFVGPGRRVLTETRLSANAVRNAATPYRALPGATVLVRSPTLDDRTDVAGVTLGGGPFVASDERRWTVEGANETIWNARGRRHRFKALAWMRGDGLRQEAVGNALGNYGFNSIDDFAANRPASFTRTLSQPERVGTVWNGAAALAHQWTPSRWFNVLYGARVEANVFGDRPPANAALERALGVRTGAAPARVHVSPRAGFSFTYNRDRENGSGTSQSPVGRFYRTTAGVVRGGIGEFRDLLRPGLLADASASTGLPGSTSVLSCVGAAVPEADWGLFASNPAAIPGECAGGGGVLAERAPSVTLIDPSYDVPRSWRATLDWNTSFRRVLFRVNALGSYDLNQPGVVDANFAGTSRFALAGEGNRPVFVTPAAIDPASGAVSAAEARRSADYGRVGVRTSDLRGYGGQLTFTVQPDVFKFRSRHQLFGSVGYTLQGTRRQFRGFDGAAFGDPTLREWAAGPNDARHAFVITSGFNAAKVGTVTLFARAQSGLPFTPLVQGDVNGDGRGGDRAFVPDAATDADVQTAAQLRTLLASGADGARECLTAYAGRVAARNGCRGPWTQTLNMQWRPPIPRRWARRVTTNVYLSNVLGGLDQLFHGDEGLRGWGGSAQPDPVLLVPRGFDAASRRFRYDVNPRFGDTRGRSTLLREPFRLSIDFSVDLAVAYPVQQLRRALEPVRAPDGGWTRRSADSLTAFYLSRTSNIHRAVLSESDSLFLSRAQTAALQRADSAYSAEVRAMYADLGRYLASRPEGEPGKAELDSVAKVEKAYWKVFWRQPEAADSVLTPTQRELFPMLVRMAATPQKERENSQWQFGFPVPYDPEAWRRPVQRRSF